MDIFTNKILPLFDRSGKSDMELEREIGLPRSIIYDWRNGRSKSYKKYLVEISNYFGVSVESIAGNEQKNKPAISSGELQEKLKPLYEITKDFTDEERAALVEYAEFLAAKRKKSNLE